MIDWDREISVFLRTTALTLADSLDRKDARRRYLMERFAQEGLFMPLEFRASKVDSYIGFLEILDAHEPPEAEALRKLRSSLTDNIYETIAEMCRYKRALQDVGCLTPSEFAKAEEIVSSYQKRASEYLGSKNRP